MFSPLGFSAKYFHQIKNEALTNFAFIKLHKALARTFIPRYFKTLNSIKLADGKNNSLWKVNLDLVFISIAFSRR